MAHNGRPTGIRWVKPYAGNDENLHACTGPTDFTVALIGKRDDGWWYNVDLHSMKWISKGYGRGLSSQEACKRAVERAVRDWLDVFGFEPKASINGEAA